MTRLKSGRSVSAKNTLEEENTIKASRSLWRGNTHKTDNINNLSIQILCTKSSKNEPPEEETPEELSPEENNVPGNHEISIHYIIGEIWNRNEIVVDNIFSFKIALNITKSNDAKVEPQIVEECWRRNDWP